MKRKPCITNKTKRKQRSFQQNETATVKILAPATLKSFVIQNVYFIILNALIYVGHTIKST